MKKAGKILVFLVTIIFLWILIIPLNPVKIGELKEKYNICNTNNLDSWSAIQARIQSIKTVKFFNSPEIPPIELTYFNTKERPLIQCLNVIPAYTLYKARTLNVKVKINQPAEFGISLRRVNIGPGWKKRITPNEINKPLELTWPLERDGSGIVLKLNWLSGDFDGAVISLDQFDHTQPLIVTIYEMYLK